MNKFVPTKRRTGFSLIEVTMALGIVAFGFIALLGLLPTGLNLARECRSETLAVNILSALASDLQYHAASSNKTALYQIAVQEGATGRTSFDENGRWLGTVAGGPDAVYAGSWEIRAPSNGMPAHAWVRVAWPEQTPQPTGMVEALVILSQEPGQSSGGG